MLPVLVYELIKAQNVTCDFFSDFFSQGGLLWWLLPSPHRALLVFGLPSGFALATALAHTVPLNVSTRGYHSLAGKRKDEEEVGEENGTNSCNNEEAKVEEEPKSGPFEVFSRSWFRSWCSSLLKLLEARRVLRSSTGCVACCGAARCVCFLLVLLTHVELLRYLYLVVVPGEQKRCAVW